jgi:hypothetical protein
MAKIPLRMPMLPKETPTPIPTFRPVLSLVAPSAVEVGVDGEEGKEADEVEVEEAKEVEEIEDVLAGIKFQPFS